MTGAVDVCQDQNVKTGRIWPGSPGFQTTQLLQKNSAAYWVGTTDRCGFVFTPSENAAMERHIYNR